MEHLLTASIVLVVGLVALGVLPRHRPALKAAWITLAFGLFTIGLARQVGSPIVPSFDGLSGWRAAWTQVLEAAWWLVGARMIVAFMHAWVGPDRKLGNSRLATDIIAGAVYLFAALAITNDVFQIPIRGLVATSGVIAIVLGLALQSTLSDVFSGISINIEQPFGTGDMIQIDGVVEGTVTQVNWRATHILTGMDDVAVIPNSVVAKSRIINRSRPAKERGASLTVSLDAATPPDDGLQVLRQAAMLTAGIMRDPAPVVQCTALRGTGVDYEIFFHVRSDSELGRARTEMIRLVHRSVAWAGMAITRTDGVPAVLPAETEFGGIALRKMRLIGLFDALSAEEVTALAAKATQRILAPGDVAIAQGKEGDGLFIVESGVLEVTRVVDGATVVVGRLGPADHFGETALLAGDPFAATATAITPVTLYLVSKAALAPLMAARPALIKEFCNAIDRQRAVFESPAKAAFIAPASDGTGEAILHRIERFFRAPLRTS